MKKTNANFTQFCENDIKKENERTSQTTQKQTRGYTEGSSGYQRGSREEDVDNAAKMGRHI